MLVLTLDTATPIVVVGVVDVDDMSVRAAASVLSGNRHAETLGELIPALLGKAGTAMTDLTAVVVGLGPGPFTGLRIGVVTAAALADALGIPVYGVCTHDAIAASYVARGGPEPVAGRFAVVTDARRRECYWADYDASGARIAGPEVQRPSDLLASAQWRRDGLVVGNPAFSEVLGIEIRSAQPDPVGLVVAAPGLITGVAPGPLEPMYLRRPDATPPTARKPVTNDSMTRPKQTVRLRPLRLRDLPPVMSIEEELFAPDMWTEAMLRDELSRPESRYYLAAEVEGVVVGYGGFVDYGDEGHIATIGVREAFQGKGIGALLLDALLVEADRRVPRVLLEVREDSPVPQRLYRSRGFSEIGRRPNYYPLSGADAVVMARG